MKMTCSRKSPYSDNVDEWAWCNVRILLLENIQELLNTVNGSIKRVN